MIRTRTEALRRVLAALLAAAPFPGLAEAAADDGEHFFERRVRPLLAEHCYGCHSQESGKSKGSLLLDSRQGWEAGGDSGPAIVPGDPDGSLLIRAVRYDDPDLEMPPKGRLPQEAVGILEAWVRSGAPDPRQGEVRQAEGGIDLEAGRRHWAFRPPVFRGVPPEEPARSAIDAFLLQDREEGSVPARAPYADIVRRLHFDLAGLPPDPELLEQSGEASLEAMVDRLLASPRFGETWGRHWLDLARYSESTGGGRSALLPNAWRYRNYVIDSFNRDKPFGRFLEEQIAGDLLPEGDEQEVAEARIATAFLVLGPKNLDLQDKELLRMNAVDEQIDTVTRTFLGLTVSCARCHDHKFDPIPATDYYALAGIFRSTRSLKRSNVSTLTRLELPTSPGHREAVAAYEKERKSLASRISALAKKKDRSGEEEEELARRKEELEALDAGAPPPLPLALGVSDEPDAGDYHLCIRGNVHQKGDPVRRGFLQVLMGEDQEPPEIPEGQSGRLELARWMSSPGNPLVARVWANRVWHHLFGRGIVATVDNFGIRGAPPSHPELLDYLALRFQQQGGSTKALIREIVLSEAYKSASSASEEAGDGFFGRPRRRLNAEAIRDAILHVSGRLEHHRVESAFPDSVQNDTALQKVALDVPSLLSPPRRSVYIPVLREEGLNPLLKAFDFANPGFPVGRRSQSVLPTQALYLMNSGFVMEEADRAARRLLADLPEAAAAERIRLAWTRSLGRPPHPGELKRIVEHLGEDPSSPGAWGQVFHSLFCSVDFRYLK